MGNAVYVGVDSSSEMLKRARDKLMQRGLGKRSLLTNQNFRRVARNIISSTLRQFQLDPKIFGVMSTLALHHCELNEKKNIYELAHALLQGFGLLVLTDSVFECIV